MSVSTDGQICFGLLLDEAQTLPWDNSDMDLEDWWAITICGFKRSFELPSINPSSDDKYHYLTERIDFNKAHPLPVVLVNVCSANCPVWILAIPSSCMDASRGYPEVFNPSDLVVTEAEKQALLDFVETHQLVTIGEPSWYLSSYWGV